MLYLLSYKPTFGWRDGTRLSCSAVERPVYCVQSMGSAAARQGLLCAGLLGCAGDRSSMSAVTSEEARVSLAAVGELLFEPVQHRRDEEFVLAELQRTTK